MGFIKITHSYSTNVYNTQTIWKIIVAAGTSKWQILFEWNKQKYGVYVLYMNYWIVTLNRQIKWQKSNVFIWKLKKCAAFFITCAMLFFSGFLALSIKFPPFQPFSHFMSLTSPAFIFPPRFDLSAIFHFYSLLRRVSPLPCLKFPCLFT